MEDANILDWQLIGSNDGCHSGTRRFRWHPDVPHKTGARRQDRNSTTMLGSGWFNDILGLPNNNKAALQESFCSVLALVKM